MPDLFEDPFAEPEPEPSPIDFKQFPYFDVYKVRNMFFAVDVPVFTAAEGQEVGDGYVRFKHVYCCN